MAERVAIVTGGASGIGLAIALALRASNYRVLILDRDASALERVKLEHRDLDSLLVDITDREALESAKAHALALGEIAALVNNAGVFAKTPALEANEADIRRILSINLEAALLATSVFGSAMSRSGGGRIVNVASIAAHAGAALASAYAASKAGLVAATRSHARELAPHGISVNAVLPGYCETPMLESERGLVRSFVVPRIPLRRLANPDEVAEVVCSLITLRTPYLTGAAIPIDGGLHVG